MSLITALSILFLAATVILNGRRVSRIERDTANLCQMLGDRIQRLERQRERKP